MKKKKHPVFKQPNAGGKRGKKRVKDSWRRPRGIDNKQRVKKKAAGKRPNIGYKNPEMLRGLHPSGKREVLVHNLKEVKSLKGKDVVVRISSSVGKKKSIEIFNIAKEYGLRVLNPPKIEGREHEGKDA